MRVLLSTIVYFLSYCFLPAVGYRVYDNGRLLKQGSEGYYWSSTQISSTNGYHWNFNSGNSNLNSNPKAYGFSVRCVK